MNSRKLSRKKRNLLLLVVVVTLIVVAGLYVGLIRSQHESLANLAQKKAAAAKKLQVVNDTIHQADRIGVELDAATTALAAAERDVASGDLYSWMVDWLRQFKAPYKIDIPQFSQLGPPADVNLLPNFPYKQITLTVAGTAHYHDLGQFLADLENQFPHVRVVNLNLDANAPSTTVQPETLSFKMDIVTLARLNPS